LGSDFDIPLIMHYSFIQRRRVLRKQSHESEWLPIRLYVHLCWCQWQREGEGAPSFPFGMITPRYEGRAVGEAARDAAKCSYYSNTRQDHSTPMFPNTMPKVYLQRRQGMNYPIRMSRLETGGEECFFMPSAAAPTLLSIIMLLLLMRLLSHV